MAMAMASSLSILLLLFQSFTFSSATQRPKALIAPVTKDFTTLQYLTVFSQRTPLIPIHLVVDLGGRHLWVNCDSNYISSTYRPAPCRSALCSLADADGCGDCFSPPRPGCNNNTCGVSPYNPFISTSTSGELATDVLSLSSTTGSNPSFLATASKFLFSCAPSFLLRGLASNSTGIAGLGKTRVAPPSQLSSIFSFKRKFALCLPSSPSSTGLLFFGDGPYKLLPNIDASQSLIYTRLITNPVSTAGSFKQGEPSYEYFIGVTSIKVNDKVVPINTTLLSIDDNGVGGTKISTVNPYTVLETSIYKAVLNAFTSSISGIKPVKKVSPFGVCYNASDLGSTRVGAAVPAIDLVLESESVYWRIFGANSMVAVSDQVLCLAFVDGGERPRTSVVVGGYQLEDNLLQFDLATSRLGFSSSLLFRQTTCANFNFTSVA
ncbi:probable aspartic proteinase GIP2 [Dioscorea cayenensis subsp. rotundata]|uniref:Probable aspartic proteinase GIP2 n=1 Tax=Dioscorea cayennensis subsp. rotundata TaxID=55577 RepID=A0AB40D2N7_DIOCR|nr:probable aspartic proteinase GIP2 [Dioscorea cayenensis subsp. rotundata]